MGPGKEVAEHVCSRVETGIPGYFGDPRSPWQRPSSENTNGLLRQYFPRSTVLTATQAELDVVARELNGRRRQTLGGSSPVKSSPEMLRWSVETGSAKYTLSKHTGLPCWRANAGGVGEAERPRLAGCRE